MKANMSDKEKLEELSEILSSRKPQEITEMINEIGRVLSGRNLKFIEAEAMLDYAKIMIKNLRVS